MDLPPPVPPQPLPVVENAIAEDRLRWLSLCHYVAGAMAAIGASFFLLYAVMFLAFSCVPMDAWEEDDDGPADVVVESMDPVEDRLSLIEDDKPEPPPQWLFGILGGVFLALVILGWCFAALTIYAGVCLKKRRHRLLIQITAALNCLFIPYGTLLGVLTLVALETPAARRLFGVA